MPLTENNFGLAHGETQERDLDAIEHLVMFHYPCNDGFAAAWVASQYLDREKTYFWPCNYTDPAWGSADDRGLAVEEAFDDWSVFDGRKVYVLDFSFPVEVLLAIAKRARSIVVCDHHLKFRQQLVEFGVESPDLAGWLASTPTTRPSRGDRGEPPKEIWVGNAPDICKIYFHDYRCGAQIASWYFSTFVSNDRGDPASRHGQMARFLRYIADRDLWLWQEADSRSFHAALANEDQTFDNWDSLWKRDVAGDPDFAEVGDTILKYQQRKIDGAARKAFFVNFEGELHPIPVVNATSYGSEICARMLELHPTAPFAACYFDLDETTRVWSLRARKDDGVDVCAIARERGGGGHMKAAGFRQQLPRPRGIHRPRLRDPAARDRAAPSGPSDRGVTARRRGAEP